MLVLCKKLHIRDMSPLHGVQYFSTFHMSTDNIFAVGIPSAIPLPSLSGISDFLSGMQTFSSSPSRTFSQTDPNPSYLPTLLLHHHHPIISHLKTTNNITPCQKAQEFPFPLNFLQVLNLPFAGTYVYLCVSKHSVSKFEFWNGICVFRCSFWVMHQIGKREVCFGGGVRSRTLYASGLESYYFLERADDGT